MRNYKGKLVGILGTVIIHLIAGIIFMSFKIQSLNKDFSKEFVVEIAPADEPEVSEKLIELPVSTIEKILQGDEELLNIARNLANRSDVKIDPMDYIDKVKEELIQSGKLGLDNYIDEKKRLNEMSAEENLAFENKTAEDPESDKPKESQEMAANYQGPTRIYYDLAGRNHTYLPIPIYKCLGSGKIVLSIQVNQKGIVEDARVIANESTTSDLCLVETAVNSALISRFNQDINSPKIQTGTLSYHFVAQ
ncbi:MAG: hypothetical protein MUO72_13695 [Bacteroidales bacterium]|nr:hypothetical protein [Bacteroidales bacterium]